MSTTYISRETRSQPLATGTIWATMEHCKALRSSKALDSEPLSRVGLPAEAKGDDDDSDGGEDDSDNEEDDDSNG